MSLPKVAIIGRPNVGKSSLFNALADEQISIVESTAGVTRDRVSTVIERNDRYFELIDTGGYGVVDKDHLSEHIEKQIHQAIGDADLIIFMVDIRDGLVPFDTIIAKILRKENFNVIAVANKADTVAMFPSASEFSKLGLGEFLCISATNNINKNELVDAILKKLDKTRTGKPAEPVMKIAVVGKRNAGKSTLVNAIVGQERMIVSEVPGTTRDAVDIRFERDGHTFVVIDTAGVRKKSKLTDSVDFYSQVRVIRTIRRADVVLLMIDSTEPLAQVDKKLAGLILEEHKSCVIVVNKWDLAKEQASPEDYEDYLTKSLPGLKFAPIAFTVATKAENINGLLELADQIFRQSTTWIPTAKLNEAFEAIKEERSGPSKGGIAKIYYATQIAVNPIAILMFVNKPELFDENYRRYVVGRLRQLLPIQEVPIRLLVRSHRKEAVESKG